MNTAQRIAKNTADEAHDLAKITKIVAGMDEETTEDLAELYGLITNVYKAKDIRTASTKWNFEKKSKLIFPVAHFTIFLSPQEVLVPLL